MNRQLNIFDIIADNTKIRVDYFETDKYSNALTETVIIDGVSCNGIIKNGGIVYLTRSEVIAMYEIALKINKGAYGFYGLIKHNNRYYEVFFRFGNIKTAHATDIFSFIDKNWSGNNQWIHQF